jgi:RES domain-containing protein
MYKDDLLGTGAKLFGGRWNSVGLAGLYATENISLAVLEILVRAGMQTIPISYHLVKIDVPDTIQLQPISADKLRNDWKDDIGYTQWIGDEFLRSASSLMLKIPSAIVDEENNYLVNPKHGDFKKVKIIKISKFQFDKRLFLKDE